MEKQPSIPFLWPETRVLEGQLDYQTQVPFHSVVASAKSFFGQVTCIDEKGVKWLQNLANGPDAKQLSFSFSGAEEDSPKARIILALYGACGTLSEHLDELLQLQESSKRRFEFRIFTTDISFVLGSPSNILCCLPFKGDPAMLIGPTSNFGLNESMEAQVNFVFKAEAPLVDEYRKWFELIWHKSAPLTEETIAIPFLVPAKGTGEAEEMWRRYEDECERAKASRRDVEIRIEVDPESGEVTAFNEHGEPIEPPTEALEVERLDQVAIRIGRLYSAGAIVTIDKATRIPPLEAPMKAEWFGFESFRQIGTVSRQMQYKISVFDDKLQRDIDNKRKKIRQLINSFSFSLADSTPWMPHSARDLFEQEMKRANEEGRELLGKTVGNNVDAYVEAQMQRIAQDANKMYRELNQGGALRPSVIEEIITALKARLHKALEGNFLPQVSFLGINFCPEEESEIVSPWGQALSLLEEIAKFPRKLFTDRFMMQGLRVDEDEYAEAMDVLEDIVLRRKVSKYDMKDELKMIDQIMRETFTHREKCELLLDIIDGKESSVISDKISSFVTALTAPAA